MTPSARSAIITGITGQDGAYLAKNLLARGYSVIGTSRCLPLAADAPLTALRLADAVSFRSLDLTDQSAVAQLLAAVRPDEIYHLAGQSSVGRSFEIPAETTQSIIACTLNVLQAAHAVCPGARIFHASSSECFGDLGGEKATEQTEMRPISPYGVAKAAAHRLVDFYREQHGLFAVNGILFNHESPLRSPRFVTCKIARAAAQIANEGRGMITLGDLHIVRDWGWAEEFVSAMVAMLQCQRPQNLVIATGTPVSLEEFVAAAFAAAGLDWRDHIARAPQFVRPSDSPWSAGDPSLAQREINWRATIAGCAVAEAMVRAELAAA